MTIKRNAMGAGTPAGQASSVIGSIVDNFVATGTTQANAALLSLASNTFVVTGAGNTGVILPPGNGTGDQLSAGDWVRIYNYTGNSILVYPPVGGKLANGTANASITLANTKGAAFLNRNGLDFGVITSA